MMEAIFSSETSVLSKAIRRNMPEVGILHSHRREKLISYRINNILISPSQNMRLQVTCEVRELYVTKLGLFPQRIRQCRPRRNVGDVFRLIESSSTTHAVVRTITVSSNNSGVFEEKLHCDCRRYTCSIEFEA
jgi:hypothetical protein